jgi:hypothetical protein
MIFLLTPFIKGDLGGFHSNNLLIGRTFQSSPQLSISTEGRNLYFLPPEPVLSAVEGGEGTDGEGEYVGAYNYTPNPFILGIMLRKCWLNVKEVV